MLRRQRSKLEVELKVRRAYDHDFGSVVAWLAERLGETDVLPGRPLRSWSVEDTYFDSDFALFANDRSFRAQRKGRNCVRYNYKYVVSREETWLARRELSVETDGGPLDLENPLHRRLPVLEDLAMMADAGDPERFGTFCQRLAPVVRLRSQRIGWYLFNPSAWLEPGIALSIDRVEAVPASRSGSAGAGCAFSELELELDVGAPHQTFALLSELARELRDRGYEPTHRSKYQHAVDVLGLVGEELR